MEDLIKMDDLGYLYFWKHPYLNLKKRQKKNIHSCKLPWLLGNPPFVDGYLPEKKIGDFHGRCHVEGMLPKTSNHPTTQPIKPPHSDLPKIHLNTSILREKWRSTFGSCIMTAEDLEKWATFTSDKKICMYIYRVKHVSMYILIYVYCTEIY